MGEGRVMGRINLKSGREGALKKIEEWAVDMVGLMKEEMTSEHRNKASDLGVAIVLSTKDGVTSGIAGFVTIEEEQALRVSFFCQFELPRIEDPGILSPAYREQMGERMATVVNDRCGQFGWQYRGKDLGLVIELEHRVLRAEGPDQMGGLIRTMAEALRESFVRRHWEIKYPVGNILDEALAIADPYRWLLSHGLSKNPEAEKQVLARAALARAAGWTTKPHPPRRNR